MEEVVEADFIHVVDANHHFFQQFRSVLEVLAEPARGRRPSPSSTRATPFTTSIAPRLVADPPNSGYRSASTGEGKEYLERLICMMVEKLMRRVEVILPYDRGDLLAFCHDRGRVISQEYLPEGVRVEVELSPDLAARIARYSQDQGNRMTDASNL